jgi:hypothetical protein
MHRHNAEPARSYLDALAEFEALLAQPRTRELDWQKLFASCPDLLAQSLPLRVSAHRIEALARPGRAEADFLIHPDPSFVGSPRGVIELKTPQSPVLRFPRKDQIILSRSAATAVNQVHHYSSSIQWPDRVVLLGNALYLFVIMGISQGWADKLQHEICRKALHDQLRNVTLLGYDQLFKNAVSAVPRTPILLVPHPVIASGPFVKDQRFGIETVDYAKVLQGFTSENPGDALVPWENLLRPYWEELHLRHLYDMGFDSTDFDPWYCHQETFVYVHDPALGEERQGRWNEQGRFLDRLIFAYGFAHQVSSPRKSPRLRDQGYGYCYECGETRNAFPYDKGHYIAHSIGGKGQPRHLRPSSCN